MAMPNKSRAERRREEKLSKKQAKDAKSPAGRKRVENPVHAEVVERLRQIEKIRQTGEVAAALQACQQLYSAHPDKVEVLFAAGALNLELERYEGAYGFLKRVVELAPERGDFWLRFSSCLYGMRQLEAARIAAMNAVQRMPRDLNALYFLGNVCRDTDDNENALLAFNAILELKPGDLRAMFGKARSLMVLGRIDEAEDLLLAVVDKDPMYFSAYQNLLRNKSTKIDIEKVRELGLGYIRDHSLSDDGLISIYFTLAYIEDREKNYDQAFQYYLKANAIKFGHNSFDPTRFSDKVNRLIEGFSAEAVAELAGGGSMSDAPIFIVGMPRSGTTLTEQILSSHSKVHGAGELRKVSLIVKELTRVALHGFTYPLDMHRFDHNALRELGEQYLDVAMRNAHEGAERVVDKMPGNIVHLGLIATMFPNATLIHCMRDPMDTAVSCFMQNFKEELSFASDLASLGYYYRESLRLMDHWKKIFPGRIMEVRYEETVADQEAMSRKLIAHAGLEWEDQCLEFHKTERSVQTASLWQVRQPIYKTSVERWRRYEKHLGPLIDALNGKEPETA
ncbi:MAG: hypothetical protein C0606_12195 [Hyphomicrobiales bacterium]|nr:MAG: hypothetical protein C0606_12195 [Hyphomicrobiales bacterium]